jgi:Rrf2 family transcriptional regulator, cysteine metabolism repressor
MKGINRDTDYAARALLCMAKLDRERGETVVTVDRIVKIEGLPRVFLRRLLQQLARKKVLNSHRGKGGGFSLRRRPETITIGEIIEIFQGPVDITHCVLGAEACPRKSYCKLRARLKSLNEQITEELRKITIAELL